MTSVTFPTESSATEVDGSVAHVLPWEYAVTGARRHRGGHQPLTRGLVSPGPQVPDSTVVERSSAGAMSSNAERRCSHARRRGQALRHRRVSRRRARRRHHRVPSGQVDGRDGPRQSPHPLDLTTLLSTATPAQRELKRIANLGGYLRTTVVDL
jgi:hypothetical protein